MLLAEKLALVLDTVFDVVSAEIHRYLTQLFQTLEHFDNSSLFVSVRNSNLQDIPVVENAGIGSRIGSLQYSSS